MQAHVVEQEEEEDVLHPPSRALKCRLCCMAGLRQEKPWGPVPLELSGGHRAMTAAGNGFEDHQVFHNK